MSLALNKRLSIILSCLLLCLSFSTRAQLTANFTIDKAAGCSPLEVTFTNSTTGASPSATYEWNFGNGGSSDSKTTANAIYIDEKVYTVRLKVTDGGQSSTKQATITVYRKPKVDFSAVPSTGCAPLPVTFKSNSDPQDGTIASYLWDFGDGNLENGASFQTVNHTYKFANKPTVRLTVTTSNGCYATATKNNIVTVLAPVVAKFSVDRRNLCEVPAVVGFINESTGPGLLDYTWDLGDGKQSTSKNPLHNYDKKGLYDVSLIVKNESGCADTIKQEKFINAANFVTDFDVPAGLCTNSPVIFTSKSNADLSVWNFTDNNQVQVGNSVNHTFLQPGTYDVTLTNTFGTCKETVTKKVTLLKGSSSTNIVADVTGSCLAPLTVNFKDTSSGATAWKWTFGTGIAKDTSNEQNPSFTYTLGERDYTVNLVSENANGCKNMATKTISIRRPRLSIAYTSSSSPYGTRGCPGMKVSFEAYPSSEIVEYNWSFGDGGTSTVAKPSHVFDSVGSFSIKLVFKTKSGCIDSTINSQYITTYQKPVADFKTQSGVTDFCGKDPVFLVNTSDIGDRYEWSFGNGQTSTDNSPGVSYGSGGNYTVTLIQWNQYCSDTTVKEAFLKGTGPFPSITSAVNTCAGNRGTIEFQQTATGTQQWKWSFGDGTDTTLNTNIQTIRHNYKQSGQYKVYLTVSDGKCSSRDSISVDVFIKQNPVITADKNVLCGSDNLTLTLSNVEAVKRYGITYYFYQGQYQFSDGTLAADMFYNYLPGHSSVITKIPPRKDSIRLIIYDYVYGCNDTSNYVPVNIAGPVAKFDIVQNSVCAEDQIRFTDKSTSTGGVPISKWIWNYGDGKSDTLTSSANPSHRYDAPNYYRPSLKVIDTAGCFDYTFENANYIQSYGPQASFTVSDTVMTPNSPITFTNTTLNYPGGYTEYKWDFGDGKTSNEYSPTHSYDKVGSYTIKLYAFNTYTGCRDTVIKQSFIQVKTVVASFTLNTIYPGGKSCPPMVANFVNTSINALSVLWDFGDGGGLSDNPSAASRTYYQPGVYRAVLYAYGRNGAIDSTVQFITVNGPYGTMVADTTEGCSPFAVKLISDVKNTISYRWDFGDGAIDAKDSATAHTYVKPGIYVPRLILRDAEGCPATFELGDTIIVDKLTSSITNPGNIVCDSAVIDFKSLSESLARDSLKLNLNYQWTFGNTVITSDKTNENIRANYTTTGTYLLSLKVSSPYGCLQELKDTVLVAATPVAAIQSIDAVCEDNNIMFTANADQPEVQWNWKLSDGRNYSVQNAGDIRFDNPGNYNMQLLVKNQYGCVDTVTKSVTIHPDPVLTISPKSATVCFGDTIRIEASGAATYNWSPNNDVVNTNGGVLLSKPLLPVKYYLNSLSEFGCVTNDSVQLQVSYPFDIEEPADAEICLNDRVVLKTSGAVSYQWTPTQGINNPTAASVIATPQVTTDYMVVGYGNDACFTDTARFTVVVNPLPVVNAGDKIETTVGSVFELKPELSNDIVQIRWNPATYLNCYDCATPKVTPQSDITYRIQVTNNFGCIASDTVSIRLSCPNTSVFIPNTFTPNGDGLNDVFFPKGKGIRTIKYLRVFNRWGELIYEKTNFNINDERSGWDGSFKGKKLPPDVFVFDTEMVCDNNQTIKQYGNLMILK